MTITFKEGESNRNTTDVGHIPIGYPAYVDLDDTGELTLGIVSYPSHRNKLDQTLEEYGYDGHVLFIPISTGMARLLPFNTKAVKPYYPVTVEYNKAPHYD